MLSGEEILREVENGNIVINPFNPVCVNPNSYNMTLSDELLVYTDDILDSAKENAMKHIKIPKEGYTLAPNTLYIAKTVEYTETDKYVPQLSGRSSIGRVGLTVHISAGFGSVGYKGNWTLGITCVRPTKIFPNMEICQIYFYPVYGKVSKPYDGKYQNKGEITGSKSHLDFQKDKNGKITKTS